MTDESNRWGVLGLLFLIGLTAPVQFQSVAALAPFLIEEGRLSYTDVGVLAGIFMLPGIVLAAPLGPLSARLGERLTLVLGILLMAGSAVAFALTDSYGVMLASRLSGGLGAMVASVLLPKAVTDWFVGKEIATAMAIIAVSVGLGIGLAMALLPLVAVTVSWRAAMLANAAFSAVAIPLVLIVYRARAGGGAGAAGSALLWNIDRHELVLSALAGVGRGLFSAAYAVFMSFAPALLIARGMAPVEAGLLTSVAAFASLVSVPLGGFLSDRTRRPNAFIVGGSIGSFAACLLAPAILQGLVWVLLFGILRGGCTGGIMSLPSRVLRPESRNSGFAVVSAVYFVCMAVFPPLGGWLLDATGNAAAPVILAGALYLLITALLALFLTLERRWLRR